MKRMLTAAAAILAAASTANATSEPLPADPVTVPVIEWPKECGWTDPTPDWCLALLKPRGTAASDPAVTAADFITPQAPPVPPNPVITGTDTGNPGIFDPAVVEQVLGGKTLVQKRMPDGTLSWDFSPFPLNQPEAVPATTRTGGSTGSSTEIDPLAAGGWHSKGG